MPTFSSCWIQEIFRNKNLSRNHLKHILDQSLFLRAFTRNISEKEFRRHVYAKYFVILLSTRDNESNEAYIAEIFGHFYRFEILNVNLLIQQGDAVIVYTYYPFVENSCGKVHPTLHNKYVDHKFLYNIPLFPDKLEDFKNCSIPVAFIRRNETGYDTIEQGRILEFEIEERLFRIIAQKLNFRPDFYYPPDLWGIVLDDDLVLGSTFTKMTAREIHVAVGLYYQEHMQYRNFDQSFSYYTTWFTFAVPPGRPYTSVEKLLKPFKIDVWLQCAAIVICTVLFKCTFSVLSRKTNPSKLLSDIKILDFLRILFGLSLPRFPAEKFSKTLLLILILGIWIIRTMYQSSLITFIVSDKGHAAIRTISQMVDENLKMYIMTQVAIFLEHTFVEDRFAE